MKKFLLFFLLIGFLSTSEAQISHGGEPLSIKLGASINKSISTLKMPAYDQVALDAEDALNDQHKDIPWRFGYNHLVNITPQNSGTWEDLGREAKLWRLRIESTGALSINLTFDKYFLPEGAKLFIYNEDKSQIIGALTSENNKITQNLGTTLLSGDAIILEYFEPGNVTFSGQLSISKVTHGYRKMLDSPNLEKGFGSSGSCNNNVVCPEGLPWQDQIRSVAVIVVNGNENCTGALINNTCEDETPYFLTADHCLGGDISTWVFRFNWESPDCSPSVDGPYNYTVSGATERASNGGSDFALLELSSIPPSNYNVYYAGWDNTGTAPTNSIAIHHPSGDVKKISFDNDPATTASWNSADTWHIADWEDGTTEPGSSGSPLFNQDGRIIGQLYGGTANCGNNIDDYYGRFDVSWTTGGSASNQLVDWLDGCTTGATTIDGFDPNQSTLAVDANLLSINSPVNGQITCDNNLSPEISFKNKGMDTLFEVTINYEIDGGSVESITWQDTLITNGSELITFPSITVSTGVHQFIAWTSNPNQSTDLNMTNDTSTSSFEVINPSGTALPLTEGFESSTFPNTDWDLINPDNSYTWETASTVSGFESSTTSIILNNFESDFSGQRDGLQTPYLDFTTAVGGTIALEFNVAYARYSNFYHDSLLVKVSTDCGQTWQTLYAKGNNDLSTNGNVDQSNLFVPISSEWRTETITLDSYAGTPKIQFQFENYSGYGNAVYLDDINIYYTPPSAFPDANFSTSNATNCAGNPVQFNDETLFGPTQWAWSFNSGTPATSTAQNPEITFNMFGTFNVELIATNSFGSDTASSTITIINSPIISATSTNESTPGASDGTATANASGGNTPYTYLWDNGETTSNISGLSIGKYTVTVFDASGCYNQADASISLVSIIELNSNSFFKLYPNPSTGNLTLEWIDTPSSAVEITVYNVIGETIISKQNERNKTIINLDLSNYSKGIYVISVKTDTQQFTKKLILK